MQQEPDQVVNDFFERWTSSSPGKILIALVVALAILIIGRWLAKIITAANGHS